MPIYCLLTFVGKFAGCTLHFTLVSDLCSAVNNPPPRLINCVNTYIANIREVGIRCEGGV